ncbi:MAG: hypothetical protein QF752_12075 [Planctomycetota bacterium]|nr:hypothetical protein [Planctomycetota bacterium]
MTGTWKENRLKEREKGHRPVYGLVFAIAVYLGLLVILAVAPNQLLNMYRDGAGNIPSILHRYNDIGRGLREPFQGETWTFTAIFMAPIFLGIIFHLTIRDDRLKTIVYYLGAVGMGLLMIAGSLHLLMYL